MLKKKLTVIVLFLLFLSMWGCATARYVMIEGGNGVIAIPANIDLHRQRAYELMEAHCSGGFVIDREEEAVIGSETSGSSDSYEEENGSSQWFSESTTVETEWRIHFTCL